MIIRDTSPRAYEFACHAASCAPPPAGTGGSKGGSGGGGGSGSVKASDLKPGDRVHFAQKVRVVSSTGMQHNGKVGVSFKDGGITDFRPSETLPRAASPGKFNRADDVHRQSPTPAKKMPHIATASEMIKENNRRDADRKSPGQQGRRDRAEQEKRAKEMQANRLKARGNYRIGKVGSPKNNPLDDNEGPSR